MTDSIVEKLVSSIRSFFSELGKGDNNSINKFPIEYNEEEISNQVKTIIANESGFSRVKELFSYE